MILLIDNYDSFTYNLAHRLGELGAEVQVVRNDAITVDEIIERKWAPKGGVPQPLTPHAATLRLAARVDGRLQ